MMATSTAATTAPCTNGSRRSSSSGGSKNEKGQPKSKTQRKSSSLPAETVEYLKAWMMSPEHVAHPYPTEQEKAQIMADTGIELKQLTNWFVNNRKRYWKPRVEARLQQQAHAQNAAAAAAAAAIVSGRRESDNINAAVPAVNGFSCAALASHVVQASPVTALLSLDMTQTASQQPQQQQQAQQHHILPAASTGIQSQSQQQQILYVAHQETSKNETGAAASSEICTNQEKQQQQQHNVVSDGSSSGESDSVCEAVADDEDETSQIPPGSSQSTPSVISFTPSGSGDDEEGNSYSAPAKEEPVDQIDETTGIVTRKEVVDVHVLRPSPSEGGVDAVPSIKDVTILPKVPKDRIIRSFKNCAISYSFSTFFKNDKKRVQSRRDAEVVRVKKHYLKMYQSELSSQKTVSSSSESLLTPTQDTSSYLRSNNDVSILLSVSSQHKSNIRSRAQAAGGVSTLHISHFDTCCDQLTDDDETAPKRLKTELGPLKLFGRRRVSVVLDDSPLRPVFKKKNTELWRAACSNAVDDSSMPTLDEATHMFGFKA